jgi:membrane dipeptidase
MASNCNASPFAVEMPVAGARHANLRQKHGGQRIGGCAMGNGMTANACTRIVALALSTVLAAGCAGLSPRDRTDGLLVVDTHVDIPADYMRAPHYDAGNAPRLQVDLARMAAGGLDAAFFVVYVGQGPRTPEGHAAAMAAAERKYSAIERMLQRYPGRIRLATSPALVRANHHDGLLSAMIGIENGYSLGLDVDNLDAVFARGARYLGLTHTGHNELCTSSGELAANGDVPAGDRGLTPLGRAFVARANDLGMMLDVSHASDACVRDVLAASRAPVIASHSSARALADHPRNLSDELLGAIAQGGGVVQVVAYTYFLKSDPVREAAVTALEAAVAEAAGSAKFDSELHETRADYVAGMAMIERLHPRATLGDLVAHIAHAVEVAGIDHVGIASDFDGGGGVTGWMHAGETANVTEALRARGFDEAEIAKLWGGNLLRVWTGVGEAARDD